MGVLSNSLVLFGATLLLHAYVPSPLLFPLHTNSPSINPLTPPRTHSVYSAHEHALLPNTSTTSSTAANPTLNLPLDITLETLISVLLLCVGVVTSSPDLKPIQWRVWAGRMEKDKAAKNAPLGADGLGPRGNPYQGLEERPGFLDVRAKRGEFAAWVRDGAGAGAGAGGGR